MRTGDFGAPGGSFGFHLDLTPIVRRLLIANLATWIVQLGFHFARSDRFELLFALDPAQVLPWRPWQVATYMFLHDTPGPWHILFNSLILAFMGGPVERRLGADRFLRFYLACGIAGGLLTLVPPFRAPTLGASGAVLGVLTAFGLLYPNMPIYVLLVFAVPAKYVVMAIAVIQLLSAPNAHHDQVSYSSHLGGMAAAVILLRGGPLRDRVQRYWDRRREVRRSGRRNDLLRRRDEILDKMHHEGRDSLSQEEWNVLREESKRLRGDG